jgi:hypothetical protein
MSILGKDLDRLLREMLQNTVKVTIASKTDLTFDQVDVLWDYASNLIKEADTFTSMSGGEKRDWVKDKLLNLADVAVKKGIVKLGGSEVNWIIETVLVAIR